MSNKHIPDYSHAPIDQIRKKLTSYHRQGYKALPGDPLKKTLVWTPTTKSMEARELVAEDLVTYAKRLRSNKASPERQIKLSALDFFCLSIEAMNRIEGTSIRVA